MYSHFFSSSIQVVLFSTKSIYSSNMHLYNVYFYDVSDKVDFGKDAVNHTYPGLDSPWAPEQENRC